MGSQAPVGPRIPLQVINAMASNLMVRHASEIGANAIIGMRYDATQFMGGVTEVLAYGTAVITEPIERLGSE
jgi:uncharacterized protein YbjQ (UPF0145 family)